MNPLKSTVVQMCFVVFAIMMPSFPQAAEIGLSRQQIAGTLPQVFVAAVIISGQIEAGDAKKVATLLADARRIGYGRQILRLLIHSPGGLAGEAMDIGRLVRSNDVAVFVPSIASCISACVLVLAGGTTRTIAGRVGIDRPHFLRAAGPGDDLPKLLAETKKVMRDYFNVMGVAEDLVDAMFSVADGEVRILSPDELHQFRLE